MSFTNQTTNYGLPQWIGTDKPTYLVDQNGAYATIDTELYNANSNATTALSSAASAVEVAGTAATNAQTAIDSAATANTNANSAIATANTAITNAATAQSVANQALDAFNSYFSVIDTHTFTNTTYRNIFNTIGTAIANAISTYPADQYEYHIELVFPTIVMNLEIFKESDTIFSFMGLYSVSLLWTGDMYLSGSGSSLYGYDFNANTFTSISDNTVTSCTSKVSIRRIA